MATFWIKEFDVFLKTSDFFAGFHIFIKIQIIVTHVFMPEYKIQSLEEKVVLKCFLNVFIKC